FVPALVVAGEGVHGAAGLVSIPDAEEPGAVPQDVALARMAEPKGSLPDPLCSRLRPRRRRASGRGRGVGGPRGDRTGLRCQGSHGRVGIDGDIASAIGAPRDVVLDLLGAIGTLLHAGQSIG